MKDKTGKDLSTKQIITKTQNRAYNILLELEIFLLHCIGSIPSHHIRRFFYRGAGMTIGKGSTIHMFARFYSAQHIIIGDDTIIGESVVLDGRDMLLIGDHVDIASEVMIYNAEHAIQSEDFHAVSEPVIIEDYVFIGPRAIIQPGVTIGKVAVVAAGAVVTKDVAEKTIAGGVPAKPIGERSIKDLHYTLGRARWFR